MIEGRPGFKLVKKRDYSGGNLREKIADAPNLEALEAVRRVVVALARAGRISRGTLRRLDRAGQVRHEQLSSQVVVVPGGGRRTRGGLYLP